MSCASSMIARKPWPQIAQASMAGMEMEVAKKSAKAPGKGEFVLFDVFYEDGTRRSNRRVPAEMLGGLDGDKPARNVIEQQDREIAEKSGQPPLRIKSVLRSDGKK